MRQMKHTHLLSGLDYLSPDVFETTNRILEDITRIISHDDSPKGITISGFYYDKKHRTFHSHHVHSKAWQRIDSKHSNDVDALSQVVSKLKSDINEFFDTFYAAPDETKSPSTIDENTSTDELLLLELRKKFQGEKPIEAEELLLAYSHLPSSTDEYLSGLLYSVIVDRSKLPDGIQNRLALLKADIDLSKERAPTTLEPWLWPENGFSKDNFLNPYSSLTTQDQLPLYSNRPYTEYRRRVLSSLQTYFYFRDIGSSKNAGRLTLIIPILDTWDAGKGYGGLWGVLICTFDSEADRDSYLTGDNQPRLAELLLEAERLSDAYFGAGLTKIAKEPITSKYDWIELFVSRLHWIQDWKNITVKKGGEVLYRYHHYEPKTGSFAWEWKKCSYPRCSYCNSTSNNRVFNWRSDIPSRGRSDHPILNSRLITEFKPGEDSQYSDIEIEFEFPDSAIIPENEETKIHFHREIARQHLAVLRILLRIVHTRRAALRSAVSAIMGRNMSHNIGSHVMARYSSEIREDLDPAKKRDPDHRSDFLIYLQRRTDFLAEIATSDDAFWSQALNLETQLQKLNFDTQEKMYTYSEKAKSIILSLITGKQNLNATVEWDKDNLKDCWFSCPGGEVGIHAMYVILENIIRNSARHGSGDDKQVEIKVRIVDGEAVTGDENAFIKMEIIDPRTKLSDCGKLNEKDTESLPDRINKIIASPYLDNSGKPHPGNWGVREIQICANYLRKHSLSDLEAPGETDYPVIKADKHELQSNGHCLKYTIYLERPRRAFVLFRKAVEPTDHHNLSTGTSDCRSRGILLKPFTDWVTDGESVCQESAGYEFLLLGSGIELPISGAKDSDNFLARLPIRTLSMADDSICKLIDSSVNEEWIEDLNRQWAHKSAESHVVWNDKILFGIAMADDEAIKKPLFTVQRPETGCLVSTKSMHCRTSPLKDTGSNIAFLKDLELENVQSKYASAAWVDHPNQSCFSANTILSPEQTKYNWISIEGAFTDSAHSAYLNSFKGGGWEAIAAAIPRVVIMDERVQSEATKIARAGLCYSDLWRMMGVWVPKQKKTDGDTCTIADARPTSDAVVCDLDRPEMDRCTEFLRSPSVQHEEQYPVDFLVLHLTILERLEKNSGSKTLRETLEKLIAPAPVKDSKIILVTGRGVPSIARSARNNGALANVRYLPISAILESVVTRPSKLALMRALWSAGCPSEK